MDTLYLLIKFQPGWSHTKILSHINVMQKPFFLIILYTSPRIVCIFIMLATWYGGTLLRRTQKLSGNEFVYSFITVSSSNSSLCVGQDVIYICMITISLSKWVVETYSLCPLCYTWFIFLREIDAIHV